MHFRVKCNKHNMWIGLGFLSLESLDESIKQQVKNEACEQFEIYNVDNIGHMSLNTELTEKYKDIK